jgi:arylsulfatase A-like enzyme
LSRQPDILIFIIDSLRADRASCYGYERPTTPQLDRLAAEGCLFERAITAAPFSPASYASIFSNLYPHQHGVNGDTARVWPDNWRRLPELLRERGYFTFGVSNNSFVSAEMNATRGFDEFVDLGIPTYWGRQHERVLRRLRMHFGEDVARRFTGNRLYCREKGDSEKSVQHAANLFEAAGDRPTFGLVIVMDPHTPYRATRTRFAQDRAAMRRFFRQRNNRTMFTELMAKGERLRADELAVIRDLYDAETHFADDCLGKLMTARAAANRLDGTLVMVAADHGEAFGEHGVWGHGFDLTDALTRVPLVLRYPRLLPPGKRCPHLVQLHDIHPTCLAVATDDATREDEFPNSLTQAHERGWTGRDVVFSHFPQQTRTLEFMREINPALSASKWEGDMWAVRTPEWRLVRFGDGTERLYDLLRDAREMTDVRAAHPQIADDLSHRIDALREDHAAAAIQTAEPTSALLNDRLRALGYI